MERYGTTADQFAAVSAKNSFHGSLNPRAQFREEMSVQDVLSSRMIVEPLTLPMCSPIGDGAAAAVVVSERKARQLGISKPVRVVTSVMHSGWNHAEDEPDTVELCAREAYEEAGVGPEDLDVIEVHDASAPAEIMAYEQLGLCPKGEGGKLVESWPHEARRAATGEHVGRASAQGPPGGSHGPGSDRGAHRAAPGALGEAAGRGGEARAGPKRRRQEGKRRCGDGGDDTRRLTAPNPGGGAQYEYFDASPALDLSGFTHAHIDFYVEGPVAPGQLFQLFLINFPNYPSGAGSANLNTSFDVNAIGSGAWYSGDVELSTFGGNLTRDKIALVQVVAAGAPAFGPIYIDNIYFHKNTTLGIEDFDKTSFSAYPNPTQDSWTVKTKNVNISSVQVYDILGKNVLSLSPNASEVKIDATKLSKGLYFATVKTEAGSESLKLIKN